MKDSPEAPVKAKEELEKLGPMTSDEKIMAAALSVTVALWIFGSKFGIGAVAAALVGLSTLLITGVITWKECLAEGPAWDTLTWFAALIAMAAYLNKYGLIPWFSSTVVKVVSAAGLAWQPAFLVVVLLYFYSHYMFASGAAHIGAMYTAFLSVLVACGALPLRLPSFSASSPTSWVAPLTTASDLRLLSSALAMCPLPPGGRLASVFPSSTLPLSSALAQYGGS